MSKREREYIRGEKEERFKRKIRGIEKKKILGISIDVSKDYHKALIFDFEGRVEDGHLNLMSSNEESNQGQT